MSENYVLIDTDVVSFILKRDSRAELYFPHLSKKLPVISFQTTGELLRWAIVKKWGADRKKKLNEFIGNCLVVPWSGPLSAKWAEVTSEGQTRGRDCKAGDAWIGATALLYRIPLVTNNRRDFEWMKDIGLNLICEAPPLGE
ncbi:MAG: PIN domain-containing protein [Thermoplasmata archaeon]|nr:PIN domain-containing protein [Thermoplasmata archaeon]